MGSLAYVEVVRNDVDDDEDSRIIAISDAERVGDEDEVSRTECRSGWLSGTPAVAVCSFVVGCLFGSLVVSVGGYWRASSPNILGCERAAVFGDQAITPENEMAMVESAADAFVILAEMKHDPTVFT